MTKIRDESILEHLLPFSLEYFIFLSTMFMSYMSAKFRPSS